MQRRLQEEARVALALARPMARMQVEVERQIQLHRRSPVADLVSQCVCERERETQITGFVVLWRCHNSFFNKKYIIGDDPGQ